MKKSLAILLLLLLVVGCKKDEYDLSMDAERPGSPALGSPFIDAVAKGDIEAVKKHLADGADVNVGNPLNYAIESQAASRKEIVEFLLAKGADVNAKNSRGWTPAESLKRTEGAMLLIGATPEQKADNIAIARLLLQHGAQADADFKHFFPDAVAEPTAEPETPDSTPPGEEAAADPADAP